MTRWMLLLLLSVPAVDAFSASQGAIRAAASVSYSQIICDASRVVLRATPSSDDQGGGGLAQASSDNIGEMGRNAAQSALAFVQDLKSFNKTALLDTFEAVQQNILAGETGRRGELYFAIQVALGLFILTGGVPLIGGILSVLFGPVLMFSGIVAALLSASVMGQALSPWPVPNDNTRTLLNTGLYGQVRHPMYAGLLAGAVGFSVWTESAFRLLLAAALWYLLELKSTYEEEALVQRFGGEYQDYQTKVTNKFVPQALLDLLPWVKKDNNSNNALPPGGSEKLMGSGDFQ